MINEGKIISLPPEIRAKLKEIADKASEYEKAAESVNIVVPVKLPSDINTRAIEKEKLEEQIKAALIPLGWNLIKSRMADYGVDMVGMQLTLSPRDTKYDVTHRRGQL